MIVAAGWDPTSDCAKIRASMGKGMMYLQKFHDMCAYQFEMGYDALGLSPGCNVSQSLKFKSVLGIYGGQS